MDNNKYINNIYLCDGILKFDTYNDIGEVSISSKRLKIIKDLSDKELNIIDFIKSNVNFISNNNKFIISNIDENSKFIFVNSLKTKKNEYICKNYKTQIFGNYFNIDIYRNPKDEIEIKVKKEIVFKYENQIDNIQISNDKISFELVSFIKEKNELDFRENVDKDYEIYLYDNSLKNIFSYSYKERKNNRYLFEIDLLDLSKNNIESLNISIGNIYENNITYEIDKELKFKKIHINSEGINKLISISLKKKNLIQLIFDSNLTLNPTINDIEYEDNIIRFRGNLKANNASLINKDNISIKAYSKYNEYDLESDFIVIGNYFEFFVNKKDFNKFNELDTEIKKFKINLKLEEEELEYDLKYKKSKKNKLLLKKVMLEEDLFNLKVYKTKESNILKLSIKGDLEATIKKIMFIMKNRDILQVKYRTNKDIEKLLDKNILSTKIKNEFGEYDSYKTKKIGKKTFISYYKIDKIDEFIDQIVKKGIRVYCIADNESNVTFVKDIDKDNIYYNLIEKIQKSKKYKKICNVLYKKIFLNLPLRKKTVLFESFLGRNISGNPKYIYNQFVKENLDKKYNLVWILNDVNEEVSGNCKKVKRKSIKYYYYMATAKYWIFNCRQADEIVKRKGNIYLQTWHGTPLKRLGMDMDSVNMAGQNDINDYKEKFRKNSSTWNYLLAQNEYSEKIFKRAFAFNKEIIGGYPANDILYNGNNENYINELKTKFNLPKDKKIILYAPTWRDDNFYKKGHYRMEIKLELDKMQKELGDEYIILLRMHYLITNNINIDSYKGFVYDFSQGGDIQELYLMSDILITDYSSVMFDYCNLKRPMIFFTYDIEQYRDSLRGFYFDFEKEAPGPLLLDTDGIINCVRNIEKVSKEYEEKYTEFYNKFCHIDDGKSAERILDLIF